jgi:hypothetical protein
MLTRSNTHASIGLGHEWPMFRGGLRLMYEDPSLEATDVVDDAEAETAEAEEEV